ncbi:hypothetical protein CDAR_231351 [Caerostris darwini]|uniref:Uncharacterized protein n=1 Tax=Caerostris darwini TaxID=1538125 RepID=A0AAV4UYP5_9ARAC|nr:hypothetical protein CDAR_231351 [Caerostris darwini]
MCEQETHNWNAGHSGITWYPIKIYHTCHEAKLEQCQCNSLLQYSSYFMQYQYSNCIPLTFNHLFSEGRFYHVEVACFEVLKEEGPFDRNLVLDCWYQKVSAVWSGFPRPWMGATGLTSAP